MIIFKEEPKRYIRTKDGRITTLKDKLIDSIDLWVSGGKENILKIADTIEELLDCYVMTDNKRHLPVNSLPYSYYKELAELEELDKDWVVYGAIYTDKGLIFVAKMNDKGDLELL